jgi:hypothetical protein
MSLKMAPIAFVLMLGFVLLFFYRAGSQGRGPVLLFLIVPLAAFAVSYTTTRKSLKRLLALPAPVVPFAAGTASDGLNDAPTLNLSAAYVALANTPAPRRVRMARRATMNLLMPLAVVAIFELILIGHVFIKWSAVHSFSTFETRDWAALGLGLLLLFIPLSVWRGQSRERELMENGEIAVAKVVKQWSVRNGASIVYEFSDCNGQSRRQGGFDYTGKLCEGASVPVFYDRENPKRQVAACSALHEVVIAGR